MDTIRAEEIARLSMMALFSVVTAVLAVLLFVYHYNYGFLESAATILFGGPAAVFAFYIWRPGKKGGPTPPPSTP
jgi:hypothetical protein